MQDDATNHLPAGGAERERALLELGGTLRNSSRQMLATIGTTMIARMRPAMKTPLEDGVPLKIGRKPNQRCSHGSMWSAANGPEDEDPPEPEDDARNRRQHLHERTDRRPAPREAPAR